MALPSCQWHVLCFHVVMTATAGMLLSSHTLYHDKFGYPGWKSLGTCRTWSSHITENVDLSRCKCNSELLPLVCMLVVYSLMCPWPWRGILEFVILWKYADFPLGLFSLLLLLSVAVNDNWDTHCVAISARPMKTSWPQWCVQPRQKRDPLEMEWCPREGGEAALGVSPKSGRGRSF